MRKVVSRLGLFVLMAVLVFVNSVQTMAVGYSEEFWAQNNALFWCPGGGEVVLTGESSGTTGNGNCSISNLANAEQLYRWFTEAGFTAVQTAGIMGWLALESMFSPSADNGSCRGIAQWCGGRRSNLAAAGADDSLKGQFDFLIDEMKKSYANSTVSAEVDRALGARLGEMVSGRTLRDVLTNTTNMPAALAAYGDVYECSFADIGDASRHCNGGDIDGAQIYFAKRDCFAKTVLEAFKDIPAPMTNTFDWGAGGGGGGGSGTPSSGATGGSSGVGCAIGGIGGGLVSGGMTLEQAKAFMEVYKEDGYNWQLNDAGCIDGVLANCVAFSEYFIKKYTNGTFRGGHGGTVVRNLLARESGFTDGGSVPSVYSIFSTSASTMTCDGSACGHTGVILGIDTASNKIIIGEANCGSGIGGIQAKERNLQDYSSGSHRYAVPSGLKGLS